MSSNIGNHLEKYDKRKNPISMDWEHDHQYELDYPYNKCHGTGDTMKLAHEIMPFIAQQRQTLKSDIDKFLIEAIKNKGFYYAGDNYTVEIKKETPDDLEANCHICDHVHEEVCKCGCPAVRQIKFIV